MCEQSNISFIYLWVGGIIIADFIEDAEEIHIHFADLNYQYVINYIKIYSTIYNARKI